MHKYVICFRNKVMHNCHGLISIPMSKKSFRCVKVRDFFSEQPAPEEPKKIKCQAKQKQPGSSTDQLLQEFQMHSEKSHSISPKSLFYLLERIQKNLKSKTMFETNSLRWRCIIKSMIQDQTLRPDERLPQTFE